MIEKNENNIQWNKIHNFPSNLASLNGKYGIIYMIWVIPKTM